VYSTATAAQIGVLSCCSTLASDATYGQVSNVFDSGHFLGAVSWQHDERSAETRNGQLRSATPDAIAQECYRNAVCNYAPHRFRVAFQFAHAPNVIGDSVTPSLVCSYFPVAVRALFICVIHFGGRPRCRPCPAAIRSKTKMACSTFSRSAWISVNNFREVRDKSSVLLARKSLSSGVEVHLGPL